MNGHRRDFSSSSSINEPAYGAGQHAQIEPSSQTLLNGYRDTLQNTNLNGDSNTAKRSRSRSSGPLDPHDPVSMHLLMETAMGESQYYEILSIEELDQLKRELALLSSRIDATKRKLVLENKIRDAAQSFSRLDPPGNRDSLREGFGRSPKGHRRSILGSRGSLSDLLNKSDDELTSSTKKCEELAQELWKLEKRMQELQRRLLEHTAGVLQVTHTGFLKNDTPPHSPDGFSHYGYGADRDNVGDESMLYDFDDRSFYRTLDSLLDAGGSSDSVHTSSIATIAAQNRAIIDTERRLESLTNRLRESISPVKSREQSGPENTHNRQDGQGDPQITIETHLDRLEEDLEVLQEDRRTAINGARQSSFAIEKRLADFNARIRKTADETSSTNQKSQPLPPQVSGRGLDQQLLFAEQSLDTLQRNAEELLEKCQQLNSKSVFHEESAGNYEASLVTLWDSLASDHNRGLREDSQRDSAGSEDSQISSKSSEPFTLERFSGKVHALNRKAVHLREQKDILTRQIQQQRELNGKSDEQKDAQISDLTEELQRVQSELEAKQRETKEHRDELVLVTQHLDTVRQEATLQERQRDTAARNTLEGEIRAWRETEEQLVADLDAKQRDLHRLEAELADSRDDHGIARAAMRAELEESEKRVQQSTAQVEAAKEENAHRDALERNLKQQVEEKTREAEKVHEEVKSLEGEMVRLHTELTVAKAELDGAYGTRAQRAAEMASNPAIHKELEEANERNAGLLEELASLKSQQERLQTDGHESAQRVQTLQRELSETIGEFETMTKASIEFEKDREALESSLDALRDRCEEVENQLGEEKLKWIGVKGGDSSVPGSTSANVLKNEFKKMMREMRAENTKALRLEQEERRKLEAAIRSLKRDQTPGKSSLNQSVTAP
ncbi:MAG: hypothetical protein LQ352_001097 [Teloschistes flavicans]|nr:MAG: hypothetical protein LQ352_001097 [Teloschistes flavicans]